jgi:hypothetical protein
MPNKIANLTRNNRGAASLALVCFSVITLIIMISAKSKGAEETRTVSRWFLTAKEASDYANSTYGTVTVVSGRDGWIVITH